MKLEKTTKGADATTKRRFYDACGTAHALELIGERWALLVIRELMFGPKRFSELRAGLPGISANVLTQRLEGLEAAHIIRRRKLPPPASVQAYELTDWGYEAEPIIQVLGRWATRSPGHDPMQPLSAASLMMSFRTMFDAVRGKWINATIGFRLNGEEFVARLANGKIVIKRENAAGSDVIFTGEPTVIAAAVYGGAPLETLDIKGDPVLAARFVTLFPLPPKIDSGQQD
jgi:DNA-binding HxlR family transcriptional regulator